MESKMAKWLLGAIGKKLVSVLALIFAYDGEEDFENPQELDLQFFSCGHGTLACSSDGSSIQWKNKEVYESDMEEYGQQLVEDISNRAIWENVVDKLLVGADLINSTVEGCVIGVRLSFESNETVSVLNLGDELYVYRDIPKEVVDDQGIVFTSVA